MPRSAHARLPQLVRDDTPVAVAALSLRSLTRRETTKTEVAVISVCVILIVLIAAAIAGWLLWRIKRKPMRVQQVQSSTKEAIGIDDVERNAKSAVVHERSVTGVAPLPPGAAEPLMPRGIGGVEGWLQSTQRSAVIGPQDVPRTPRTVPVSVAANDDHPSPPQMPRPASPFERPPSAHSSHNLHSRQSSDHGHAAHARPLAFIKNMFGQPGQLQDIQSEGVLTPSVAKLPMMNTDSFSPSNQQYPFAAPAAYDSSGAPNRPLRPDSLILSQSAYEIYPDASASQYGGRAGKRRGSDDDHVPPMPSDRHAARASTGLGRRSSYGGMSSQGGLPLPSFYLPSEQGDSSLPGALPIGESVLASPLESRQPNHGLDVPRRGTGRRPGSNFVVTNATHSDEE